MDQSHAFGSSSAFSLGVEEELFLVDPATGAQIDASHAVLERLGDVDGTVERELHACQVELITGVCRTTAQAVDELAAVPVELGGRTRFVRRADVRFAEAHGDYVRLHTRNGSHLVRIPISRLEEHWRGVGYVRVHRSYLLAVHAVQELRSDVSGGLLAHTDVGDVPVSLRHEAPADEDTPRARTSLPAPSAVAQAGVTRAVRQVREAAGEQLPQAWRDELRRTVEVSEEQLADRLDRAVAGTDLGPQRTPLWQRGVGGLQWLLTLVALAGALWLLALVVLGFFQLDDVVPLPRVEGLPLPTLLLVGGLLAGALLALVARPLVGLRARGRARRAEQRLYAAVDVVGQEEVLAPMAEVREDHARYCASVTRARK